MDIPLQEEEDSSDEEYCPDEDEEDETAEEVHIIYNNIYLKKKHLIKRIAEKNAQLFSQKY